MVIRLVHHHAGTPAQVRADARGKIRMGIDARPHRRAAQGQLGQFFSGPTDSVDRAFRLTGVTEKLLAEPDWCRILKMCASGLDHGHEFLRLALESLL